MSNLTRGDFRRFALAMDVIGEPDAQARLSQAQMLAAAAVPEQLVLVIAKIGAQGRVTMDDLNQIAGLGYTLPRPQPMPHHRDEVVDALLRGLPYRPEGTVGMHVLEDDIRFALQRAFDLGRIT
ncbi:hypothetical protein QDA11_gp92 [Microbacterium phage Jayden]|uniref:Uncharacterized protein n=1 Tax=Microbacterium phage Jayden TaxID=2656550 RepID=A0A649VSS1_9CAUD|nr:hypothetical protein QDA11_gp92 [Microbacterium phage Jayden]QGJ95311.1 hypothetical protein PBI_JAYDEN_92 [Microbacterium phage Jayden]